MALKAKGWASKPTFSYLSEAEVVSAGCASFVPSVPNDSLETSARGLEPPFLGPGPFFAFLGGVLESSESSSNLSSSSFDSSSSLSGLDRFFVAVDLDANADFSVVCVSFLGAAFVAAGFFDFAFDFWVVVSGRGTQQHKAWQDLKRQHVPVRHPARSQSCRHRQRQGQPWKNPW